MNNLASTDLTEHTDSNEQNSIMSKEIETYNPTDDVVVYRSADNAVQLDVQLSDDTVWLAQQQMAELFDSTIPNISMHIRNIYKEEELDRTITCANFAHMGIDKDQTYVTELFNLDVIISVGYRVKSTRGCHPSIFQLIIHYLTYNPIKLILHLYRFVSIFAVRANGCVKQKENGKTHQRNPHPL